MSLIKQGKVPKPKRTIKFLLGAEGGGLNAYLTSRPEDIEKVVAALVYCSVGNDQFLCNSSLILYKSAESIPSFINDICIDAINKLSKDGLPPFKDETRDINLIRFNVLPYTPWSDNSRLMRLMIPSPLFMSWPDQHFHTQFLTSDKVDPAVLKRCGEVTTSVALLLANLGEKEALYIINVVENFGKSRFMNVTCSALSEMMDSLGEKSYSKKKIINTTELCKGELEYLAERSIGGLESIRSLIRSENVQKAIDDSIKKIKLAKNIEKEKIENYETYLLKEA
jgi:hypothetical protein